MSLISFRNNPDIMAENNHALLLADMLDNTRQLLKYFIKNLDAEKLTKVYTVDGKELNSAYWVIAHTIWAEEYLTIRTLNGPTTLPELSWLQHYGINSDGSILGEPMSMKELWSTMESVHERSQTFVRSLTDEFLDLTPKHETPLWKTNRDVLMHAIRHEGMHMGHISWLCKLHGNKTV